MTFVVGIRNSHDKSLPAGPSSPLAGLRLRQPRGVHAAKFRFTASKHTKFIRDELNGLVPWAPSEASKPCGSTRTLASPRTRAR